MRCLHVVGQVLDREKYFVADVAGDQPWLYVLLHAQLAMHDFKRFGASVNIEFMRYGFVKTFELVPAFVAVDRSKPHLFIRVVLCYMRQVFSVGYK